MTLGEERVEITFVKDGHDVVRVSVVLKNTYSVDIYQRNVRDQVRVKFWRAECRCQRHDVSNGEARGCD